MSIHQIEHVLRGAPLGVQLPPRNGKPYVTHFVYDHHYDFQEFSSNYKSAKLVGFGALKGFRFHINVLGKANLRKAFFTGEIDDAAHYLMPSPSTKIDELNSKQVEVFGYLANVSEQDDIRIHQYYGVERVRVFQSIEARIVDSRMPLARIKAAFYIDPRNTTDGHVNLAKTDALEYNRWFRGLITLTRAKCPRWYIEKVLKHLNGFLTDIEPLHICMKHIEYQPGLDKLYPERAHHSRTITKAKDAQRTVLSHQMAKLSHGPPNGPKLSRFVVAPNSTESLMIEELRKPNRSAQQTISTGQQKRQIQDEDCELQVGVKKRKLVHPSQNRPEQQRLHTPAAPGSSTQGKLPQGSMEEKMKLLAQQNLNQKAQLQQRQNYSSGYINGALKTPGGSVIPSSPRQQMPSNAISMDVHQQGFGPPQPQNFKALTNGVQRFSSARIMPSLPPSHQSSNTGRGPVVARGAWMQQAISNNSTKPTQPNLLAQNGNRNNGFATIIQQTTGSPQPSLNIPNSNRIPRSAIIAQQPQTPHQCRVSNGPVYLTPSVVTQHQMKQLGLVPAPKRGERARVLTEGKIQVPSPKNGLSGAGVEAAQQPFSNVVRPRVPSGLRNELL